MTDKLKGRKTGKDLLKEIQEVEPDYKPSSNNVYNLNNDERSLIDTPFSKIMSEKVYHIWPGLIYKKKISIFVGKAGKGKSQTLAKIAASISNGGKVPNSNSNFPQGTVLILSAEDRAADTIRPRLIANNANMEKIIDITASSHLNSRGKKVSGFVRLDTDMELLDDVLKKYHDVVLVIIDPISAYLGETKENDNADLRGFLHRLEDIAYNHNVGMILNTHFGKNIDISSVTEKIIGSIAYGAVARSIVAFCDHPDDEEEEIKRLVFKNVKNNYAPLMEGLIYKIEPVTITDTVKLEDGKEIENYTLKTSRINFTGDTWNGDLDKFMCAKKARPAGKREECKEWLRDKLAKGAVPLTIIRSEWSGGAKTLYSAKDELGIIEDFLPPEKGQRKLTFWTLPK